MPHKACITGVYDTAIGVLPNSSCIGLHAEAARGAANDAGISFDDIETSSANTPRESRGLGRKRSQ